MKKLYVLLILLHMLLIPAAEARYKFFSEFGAKQGPKQASRWTLADWMSNQDKVHLMDQWLAANRAANFFELILGAGYSSYEIENELAATTVDNQEQVSGQLALFLSIFGIQDRYIDRKDDETTAHEYSFLIRFLGTSQQTTNLTVFYGARQSENKDMDVEFSQPLMGASLTLNVFEGFGIVGEWTQFGRDKDADVEVKGTRLEYGAFIDISVLRIYANQWLETVETTTLTAEGDVTYEGLEAGIKLFF